MNKKPNRLILALEQISPQIEFECPHLGVALIATPITRAHELIAEQARHAFSESLHGRPTINDEIQATLVYETAITAQCILHDGEPIGAAVDSLPTPLLQTYFNRIEEATAKFNPRVESWTKDEYDDFLERVKKSDPAKIGEYFACLAGATLRSFSLTTVLLRGD